MRPDVLTDDERELVDLYREVRGTYGAPVMRTLRSLAAAERERRAAGAHGRPWLEVVDGGPPDNAGANAH